MQTKTYTFTKSEILALREACREYEYLLSKVNPKSPIFIKMKKSLSVLKEQFINDYQLLKG